MDIREYVQVLRRRWLSIIAVMLIVVAVTAGVNLALTPHYTATARLFFGVQSGESVTDLAQGSTFTEKQMSSYAEVATSPLVLDKVIGQLGLETTADKLAESVDATAEVDTVILMISATSTDRGQAAQIANNIATVMASVASDLSPARPDGSEAVRATSLAKAQVPAEASSPAALRNVALAVAFGMLLGVGVALLRQVLDTKIRSEQDVRAVTDSAILGVVPFDARAPSHPVAMQDDPLGARSEAVRRLRTNLQFVDVADQAKSIVVTSSIPGEGKTTTAINLAVSLADAGLKVVLVDADLRRPSIAAYLGLEGAVGLTTVLIGRAKLSDVIQPWRENSLAILPAGQIPPNPSELLGSKAMSSLLQELTDAYDMVLLDTPPLLPVTDATVLSKLAGGTMIVVGVDRIHRTHLREAIESLTAVGANLQGVVVNKIARRDSNAYVYYTGYTPEEKGKKHTGSKVLADVEVAKQEAPMHSVWAWK